jgi:hypothetical protein
VRDVPSPKACGRRRWWRFTRDVLLHECIHQYHREVTGRADLGHRGHGPAFAHTCNRIGQQLGFKPVTYPRLSHMPAEDCRFWPHVPNPRRVYPAKIVKASRYGFTSPWIQTRACHRYRRRRPWAAAGCTASPVDHPESAGPRCAG